MQVESKEQIKSTIFGYADGSSSEEEGSKTTEVTHYNDLEELD